MEEKPKMTEEQATAEIKRISQEFRDYLNKLMEEHKKKPDPVKEPEPFLDESLQFEAHLKEIEKKSQAYRRAEAERRRSYALQRLQEAPPEEVDKVLEALSDPPPPPPSEWGEVSKEWVRLPVALLHVPELSATDAVLVSILIDRFRGKPECSGACSRVWLMAKAGVTHASLDRSLKRLVTLGLIEKATDGRRLYITLTGAACILPKKRGERDDQEENVHKQRS